MHTNEERREFQRLDLRSPLPATLGGVNVTVVDLGILGARVEGDQLPDDDQCTIELDGGDGAILIECEIVHRFEFASTRRHGAGVAFVAAASGSDAKLRALLTRLVLDELKAMPSVVHKAPAFDLEQTAMRIPAPFTAHRLTETGWSKRAAFLAVQPENGFTLPASVRSAEAEKLRKDYDQATEDERRLIRLFAELRVSEVLHLPPTR